MSEPVQLPIKRGCPFDPPEQYKQLRQECPVSPLAMPVSLDGRDGWLVTRLEDAKTVLVDQRFSHRKELISLPIPPPLPMGEGEYKPGAAEPGAFITMDPPDHSRYRRMLAGHFTVRRIRELEPVVERIAARLLDEMAAAGPVADLVTAYAEPLPVELMCELVGIKPEHREPLAKHLAVVSKMSYTVEEITEAVITLSSVLQTVVSEAVANPGDDMLGSLARTGELDEKELINITWALLGGGFDTSGNMLALGTWALLEHPEQLARLRAEPELTDNAIEELLRYLTVSHLGASRAALEDVELGGKLIEAGQTIVVSLPSANRDPEKFPEPDSLDLGRSTQGHVAFGHGVHQCLGQHLARLTLRVGYRALFDRFPTLRLAVPAEEIPTREDMLHYGVHQLPVTWD
ncbi:cytochrome P450 [Kutzneria viridogrisea]|uniref:Cytochrome P450 hydroxylase n=2 Tax=Kutzneria TaxID=43356 RepID=W5WGD2_9PSEU|nr:cytochrome P450 [Kutzneria albida]AHH99927.1 cytochrome P450 hydroxylase [Kutzneria albida DSM 43870]MBA8925108.1 cytochrome P450 [Kutzneria viridogrisea]